MAEGLKLYNTLTRSKVDFKPEDKTNVRMYVCGPTVYDFAHIGNARPVIVFDVLYRLLKHLFPGSGNALDGSRVTYARNITDVDDKINARALRDFPDLPLNEAIAKVTQKTADQFHADVARLGCLEPTVEPRATDNIQQMIDIIEALIAKGHAYVAEGEVLFDTKSMAAYGQLSKRNLDEQQAGVRIAVEAHKKHPGDFVLWKLSSAHEPGWESPWGRGRPGWHIECSAMSKRYLGEVFDIHGGGLDLIFPHHENEIAQSCCANDTSVMANVWMHNGFVQVEGRKMSKSDGNFVTINELLDTDTFGGRKWPGEVLRLAMLMTHYREPIDFSVKRLEEAEANLESWLSLLDEHVFKHNENSLEAAFIASLEQDAELDLFFDLLKDDINTPLVLTRLRGIPLDIKAQQTDQKKRSLALSFLGMLNFLGLITPTSVRRWKAKGTIDPKLHAAITALVEMRLEMLKSKNFAEADKIRDDLLAKGIQLKDGKDKDTGERVTTWEVKR